jgi:hypothetical protein
MAAVVSLISIWFLINSSMESCREHYLYSTTLRKANWEVGVALGLVALRDLLACLQRFLARAFLMQ